MRKMQKYQDFNWHQGMRWYNVSGGIFLWGTHPEVRDVNLLPQGNVILSNGWAWFSHFLLMVRTLTLLDNLTSNKCPICRERQTLILWIDQSFLSSWSVHFPHWWTHGGFNTTVCNSKYDKCGSLHFYCRKVFLQQHSRIYLVSE